MIAPVRWRLRLKQPWLWWKHTWWFQWAHAPLCRRFHQDVLRLGPLRLCRSCTLVYSALALTALTLLLTGVAAIHRLLVSAALILPLAMLSYPPLYRHLHRSLRDVLRFAAGVFLAFFLSLFLSEWYWLAGIFSLMLLAIFCIFKRKRREIKRRDCEGCPELGQHCVCSGYSQQADSIRLYRQRMEEEWNRPEMISLLVISSYKK